MLWYLRAGSLRNPKIAGISNSRAVARMLRTPGFLCDFTEKCFINAAILMKI